MDDRIKVDTNGDVTIIRLLDPELMDFETLSETSKTIDDLAANCENKKILIDFNGIKFWNSLSLGFLASKNKKVRDGGRVLKYCNLSPEAVWSVRATRLHEILDICYDEETALKDFATESVGDSSD